MTAPPHLGRARAHDGRARWIWREGSALRDLTAAGMADDLAAAAEFLRAWRPGAAQAAEAALLARAPLVEAQDWPPLLPGRPGKALGIGRNFAEHARELGSEPPEELIWFAKLPDVLVGPGEPVVIPAWLDGRVDPEAEVVVLVGAPLHGAAPEQAERAIAAFTLGNDVTARGVQASDRERRWPWLRGKNLATFGPLGPWWVPAAAVADWRRLVLRGLVNGEVRQQASLSAMVWSPAAALAEISRWTPLRPGDVLFLGTPPGVAPVRPGDVLRVEADGLGVLENPVARQGSHGPAPAGAAPRG